MTCNKSCLVRNYIIVTLLVTFSLFLFLPAAIAAGSDSDFYYRVQAGDSLWLIGRKYGKTAEAIKNANNLGSDEIYPGQMLLIPDFTGPITGAPQTGTYTVKPGDSLYLISKELGISVAWLMEANSLDGYMIYPGQVLSVPEPQQQQYTVKAGDSLYLISRAFNTTVEVLKDINRLNSDILWAGQLLFIPQGNDAEIPDSGSEPPVNDNSPEGGQWGELPQGVVLYHVQPGENLWVLAERFGTTEAAIISTNHLHTNLVQVNQPLFIPQNSSQPVNDIPYPAASQKEGFGELLDWKYVFWILDTHNTAVITDLDTGKSFRARRLGGSNHADMEPLTAADTAVMKAIYGGQWSWTQRAVLVSVDGKTIAGSMAGMPHSIQTITDNSFPGHFDLHFLNSRTHNTNSIDPRHQAMVQKAAGN